MNYDFAFRELNEKVANYRWTATDIIKPESERRKQLAARAEELRLAADNFLKVCKEDKQ